MLFMPHVDVLTTRKIGVAAAEYVFAEDDIDDKFLFALYTVPVDEVDADNLARELMDEILDEDPNFHGVKFQKEDRGSTLAEYVLWIKQIWVYEAGENIGTIIHETAHCIVHSMTGGIVVRKHGDLFHKVERKLLSSDTLRGRVEGEGVIVCRRREGL